MLPIAPLMIEHRVIERMISVIRKEIARCEKEGNINPEFIDLAVDFIRTYADRCHHGKEEDILFRDLNGKNLSDEHRRTMEELLEDHRQGRKKVAELIEAKAAYMKGEKEALSAVFNALRFMTDFYPTHIAKEDKHFFMLCMSYFSKDEQDVMLKEEREFDRGLIHEIYKARINRAEEISACP